MKQELHERFRVLQSTHWWFKGREKVAEMFLKIHVRPSAHAEILDIGSGWGSMLPMLAKFGAVDVIEPYREAHETLQKLGAKEILEDDFPSSIPDRHYDLVTMFDVLEHIEDDAAAIRAISTKLLKPGGALLLTVPAHQWLWGAHDVINEHFRRYNASQIARLLQNSGLRNIRVSYCMTFLFPLALLRKIYTKLNRRVATDLAPMHPMLNASFAAIFASEAVLLRRLRLPFGLSVIAKGERPQ